MINFSTDILTRNPYFEPLMSYYKENYVFNNYIYLYLIALTIGAYYDKWIDDEVYKENGTESDTVINIPRTVINGVETNRQIEFIFRNIVLRTTKLSVSTDDRLLTAFDPTHEDSVIDNITKFLNSYANYGLEVLNKVDKTKMFPLDCIQDLFDLIDNVKNDIVLEEDIECEIAEEIEEE